MYEFQRLLYIHTIKNLFTFVLHRCWHWLEIADTGEQSMNEIQVCFFFQSKYTQGLRIPGQRLKPIG